MDLGQKGMTVIVTGGSKGIGRGICETFAREGANLVINYHSNLDSTEAFCQFLKDKYRVDVICVQGDVGNEQDVAHIFDQAESTFKRLDILVNNAGRGYSTDLWDISLEIWKQHLNNNLTGQFLMSREFARRMVPHKRKGWIVNILSKASLTSTTKGRVCYVCNKAGEIGLTHAMAIDLTEFGIHVNGVMPGFVLGSNLQKQRDEQPQIFNERIKRVPIKRVGEPWELGTMVAFLASNQCQLAVGAVMDMTGGLLLGY